MNASAISGLPAPGASRQVPQTTLGKDDFLKLLITQLSNQDPLQPVDNQAFIAQLAQFSSVEQLQGLSGQLDTLLLAQASANQMNTASLVGKEVLYRTDTIELKAGQPAALQARLEAPARLTAIVQDASGKTVRTIPLGRREAGAVDLAWDGLDDAGNPLPAGSYKVVLAAVDDAGAAVGVEMRARGRVDAVNFDGNSPLLLVGAARVKLSDVIEIGLA